MLLLRYIARRIPYVIPQLFGIILVSFFMVKLIPGDPAVMMLGPMASEQSLTALRDKMGLSKPLWQQFFYYIRDVIHGDFGTSWQTTRPVTEDLFQRFPATLELVTFGLLLALVIGFPLGVAAARLRSGPVRKFADYYGLLAGAMPDFWLALVLIYIFYTQLGWIAAPLGRIDMAVVPPKTITGSLVIDSLLTGNFDALSSSFGHLVLPVLTLGIINAGPILKMTQTMVSRALIVRVRPLRRNVRLAAARGAATSRARRAAGDRDHRQRAVRLPHRRRGAGRDRVLVGRCRPVCRAGRA